MPLLKQRNPHRPPAGGRQPRRAGRGWAALRSAFLAARCAITPTSLSHLLDRRGATVPGWVACSRGRASGARRNRTGAAAEHPRSAPEGDVGGGPGAADLHRRSRGHGDRLRARRGRDAAADDPRPVEGPARRVRGRASSGSRHRAARRHLLRRARPAQRGDGARRVGPPIRTRSRSRCAPARRSSPRRACSTRPARARPTRRRAAEEVVDEFKDFIDHVNPEDFAS